MTIESCLIEQFLPDDPEKRIKIAHPDGSDALSAVRREVVALAKHGYVCGVTNKHGYLRYVRLLVPLCAAMRIIRRFRRPPVHNNFAITRPTQSGMRWKACFDRAKLGRIAKFESVWFGV